MRKISIVLTVLTLSLFSCTTANSQNVDNGYHTVSFNTNGGNQIASQRVKHGEKATKPEDPVKGDYKFVEWQYKGETWSFAGYSVTEDITLDAKWLEKYTVTFDTQGGSPVESQLVDKGGKITQPDDPTIEHGSFECWTQDPSIDGSWDFENDVVQGDLTLYATWSMERKSIELWDTFGLEQREKLETAIENIHFDEWYDEVRSMYQGGISDLIAKVNNSVPAHQSPQLLCVPFYAYIGDGTNPYSNLNEDIKNLAKTFLAELDATALAFLNNNFDTEYSDVQLTDSKVYCLPLFTSDYMGRNPETYAYDVPMRAYYMIGTFKKEYFYSKYADNHFNAAKKCMLALSEYYLNHP